MIQPKQRSDLFEKIGLFASAAGLAIGMFSVISALPMFRFGIFSQSEPVAALMHVGGGVSAIGVALLAFSSNRIAVSAQHPTILAALALATWTLLTGVFQDYPFISWYGSPQIGEGLFWFFDIATFTAAGFALKRYRTTFLAVSLTAIGIGLALAFVMWAQRNLNYPVPVPYYFPDYLAFYGVFVFAIALGLQGAKEQNTRQTLLWTAGAIVLGGVILLISSNRGAIALALVAAPIIWIFLRFLNRRDEKVAAWLSIGVVAIVPLAVTGAVVFFGSNILNIQEGERLYPILASTLSRFNLIKVIADEALLNPEILLVGKGWGQFTDTLATNLPLEWVTLLDNFKDNRAYWDAVVRVDFHSHNLVSETFLALGVPGVILALAYLASLPYGTTKRFLPASTTVAVVTGGTWALWFQMAASLPLMALAWAALSRPVTIKKLRFSRKSVVILFGLIGCATLAAGIDSWRFSNKAFFFHPPMEQPLYSNGVRNACPEEIGDRGRGGSHAVFRLRVYVKAFKDAVEEKKNLTPDSLQRLRGLICAVETYTDGNPSFRTRSGGLLARADLAFIDPPEELAPLRDAFLVNWEKRLGEALKIAPKRTDLAASYLLWLLKENRIDKFSELAARLYRQNPKDPIALWFTGIDLIGTDKTLEEGVIRMRKAIDLGIERLMPIDQDLKKQLIGA